MRDIRISTFKLVYVVVLRVGSSISGREKIASTDFEVRWSSQAEMEQSEKLFERNRTLG